MSVCSGERKKKLPESAELLQIALGDLFKKIGEGGIAVATDKTAVDVIGNTEKGIGAAGVK